MGASVPVPTLLKQQGRQRQANAPLLTMGKEDSMLGIGAARVWEPVIDGTGAVTCKRPRLFWEEYRWQQMGLTLAQDRIDLHTLLGKQRPDGRPFNVAANGDRIPEARADEEWQAALDAAETQWGIEGLGDLPYLYRGLEPKQRNEPPGVRILDGGKKTEYDVARQLRGEEKENRIDEIMKRVRAIPPIRFGPGTVIQSPEMTDEQIARNYSDIPTKHNRDYVHREPEFNEDAVGRVPTEHVADTPAQDKLDELLGLLKGMNDRVAALETVRKPRAKKPKGSDRRSAGKFPCSVEGCAKVAKSKAGLGAHERKIHGIGV